MIKDIRNVFKRDPAARSVFEVLLCYPGLHALWIHRISHAFWRMGFKLIGRIISHIARFFTGIEIHPGAQIGNNFFIDHGMGVVIGETTEIGDDVLLYQGVVLGGTSLEKKKRHPTLKNNVIIGTGAIILGAITIGENSRVGAGSVVLHDVPANSTAVGIPARIGLGFSSSEIEALEHGKLPDPIADAIRFVLKEQEKLGERIKKCEATEGITSEIDKYLEKKKSEIKKEFHDWSEEQKNNLKEEK